MSHYEQFFLGVCWTGGGDACRAVSPSLKGALQGPGDFQTKNHQLWLSPHFFAYPKSGGFASESWIISSSGGSGVHQNSWQVIPGSSLDILRFVGFSNCRRVTFIWKQQMTSLWFSFQLSTRKTDLGIPLGVPPSIMVHHGLAPGLAR